MRIFGRYRLTKTSTSSRTSATRSAEAAVMPDMSGDVGSVTDLTSVASLEQTDELPIVRAPSQLTGLPRLSDDDSESLASEAASDVFVCRHQQDQQDQEDTSSASAKPSAEELAAAAADATANVTLFVYGWENVEPGPLSWVFPSLRAALDAVRTMRNAVEWSICSGAEWTSIDAARAKGAVLVEQNA
jgi:hypothetical protein